ncbi:MAG: AMP-binding protein [Desulfobacterota bacterium]|nr:AMP-binding protein [Thermodesulfobacteriota bacterium]MDW8001303.1 AMP-binding protein [Deltaproteobacteria bacterium]
MGVLAHLFKKGDTIPKILQHNAETEGGKPALMEKKQGVWHVLSFADYYANVRKIALGLRSVGFEEGEIAIIIGDTSSEWYFVELAIYSLGGIALGMSPDSAPDYLLHMAKRWNVRYIFAQDQEQVDKVLQIKEGLRSLKKVVYWRYRGLGNYKDDILLGIRELVRMGEEEKKSETLFEEIVKKTKSENPCTIVYTSGYSGKPKGVLHSSYSILENLKKYLEREFPNGHDRLIPLFPPVGLVEKLFSIGFHLLSSSILSIPESPQTFLRDMREVKPTLVFLPAHAWEKLVSKVEERIRESDRLKRGVYSFFMKGEAPQKPPYIPRILRSFGHLFLFSHLKRHLGLSCTRLAYNVGPLLSGQVFEFYRRIGVPLRNLYWTTETGFISASKDDSKRPESQGIPFGDIGVGLSEDGEIILKSGHNFKGYADSSTEGFTLKNGVFYTGDFGTVENENEIVLKGRAIEVTLNPLYNLPVQIVESSIRLNPYVKDVWIFKGVKREALYAIVLLDDEHTRRVAVDMGLQYLDPLDLCQKKEIADLVRQVLRKNKDVKIERYVVLPEAFCVEGETISLRRELRKGYLRIVYKELLEGIDSGQEKVPILLPKTKQEKEVTVNIVHGVDQ